MNYRLILRFLSSMNLAIMLLLLVAIASIIGTVLKQNRPYQDYLIEFGPLWQRIYQLAGLYDVYSSYWFLSLIAFLLVSISVCVIRHGPSVIRQIWSFEQTRSQAHIRQLADHQTLQTTQSPEASRTIVQAFIQDQGYRVRPKQNQLIAMKGGINRMAYFFTHLSIILICIGGLLDSKIRLKLLIWQGKLAIETRDLPAKDIPQKSQLDSDSYAFRANVSIPEGQASGIAFIGLGNGYVLQNLPFHIALEAFRITHYPNGQPRSFESDLSIYDKQEERPLQKTIRVNSPLHYKGYTIYQSSFSDGGSNVDLAVYPLRGHALDVQALQTTVGSTIAVDTSMGTQQLELTNFRRFNILPNASGELKDHGPSIEFRLRGRDGSIQIFHNYMLPIESDGRYFMLSGIRTMATEQFQFLYLPIDEQGTLKRFFKFRSLLFDKQLIESLSRQIKQDYFSDQNMPDRWTSLDMHTVITRFIQSFRSEGMQTMGQYLQQNVPQHERQKTALAYQKFLQIVLYEIYTSLIQEDKGQTTLSQFDQDFFEDAVNALTALPHYAAPVYIGLQDYTHRQASGLQITRSPGKGWVFLGFLLLVCGVFLQFFSSYQRLWIDFTPTASRTHITIGGIRTRHRKREFSVEFSTLCKQIAQRLSRCSHTIK